MDSISLFLTALQPISRYLPHFYLPHWLQSPIITIYGRITLDSTPCLGHRASSLESGLYLYSEHPEYHCNGTVNPNPNAAGLYGEHPEQGLHGDVTPNPHRTVTPAPLYYTVTPNPNPAGDRGGPCT